MTTRATLSLFVAYALVHGSMEAAYAAVQFPKIKKMVSGIAAGGSARSRNAGWAIAAYAVYLLCTFYVVVLPIATRHVSTLPEALTLAAAYGAAVYGVFNATNMFLFPGYGRELALVDFLYGIASLSAVAALSFEYGRRL